MEDPKVISVGSFEDLRSYFDLKFSHLKRELSDDQLKLSSSLVKKLKTETSLSFKFSGNKKQFEFNTESLEHVTQSLSFLDDSLNVASKAIKRRNKLIRIADKSEAGWAAVDEYLSDEVASGSEDEKKIHAAEQRALRNKKNARSAKSGQKLKTSSGFSSAVSSITPRNVTNFCPQTSKGAFVKGHCDICFACGKTGHWRASCPN
ncbi:unnamed protein product, partial [Porites lobata]